MAGGRRGSATNAPLLPFIKSNQFERDYAYACSNPKLRELTSQVWAFLELIRKKEQPPPEFVTHPMKGTWKGYSDTHIANDLVLIWRYETHIDCNQIKREFVVLYALGTHAYLGI